MPLNSRRKGKAGELDAVNWLKARGFKARRTQQNRAAPDAPDIEVDGFGWWIEVKRRERLNVARVMAESEAAAGNTPVLVMHRANNDDWIVSLRAEWFFTLFGKEASDGQGTMECALP